MIRFIDLRGQYTGYNFSFWDTVRDEFISLEGSQAWDCFEEFSLDFVQLYPKLIATAPMGIARFYALCPSWCKTPNAFPKFD